MPLLDSLCHSVTLRMTHLLGAVMLFAAALFKFSFWKISESDR